MENDVLECFGTNISIDDIPTDYCWSGYAESREMFETSNFYVWTNNEKRNIICSDENAVALGDYISKYLIKNNVISDMEGIFCPGYNQWFFLAWEMCIRCLSEFPDWIKGVFAILIDAGIINPIQHKDTSYYCILDVEKITIDQLPGNILKKIEECCINHANQHWEDELECEGEVPEPDCSDWGMTLYREFIDNHETIEITALCESKQGPEIGFGITLPIKDLEKQECFWIYEGIAESISENWEEYDGMAEETKTECIRFYRENGVIPASEEEIKKKAKDILKKKLGEYNIEINVDREDTDVNYGFSAGEISDTIYDVVLEHFAIPYCIMHDLEEESQK